MISQIKVCQNQFELYSIPPKISNPQLQQIFNEDTVETSEQVLEV